MTKILPDFETIEGLDFELECDDPDHQGDSLPAEWQHIKQCPRCHREYERWICDPCAQRVLHRRHSANGDVWFLRCRECKGFARYWKWSKTLRRLPQGAGGAR